MKIVAAAAVLSLVGRRLVRLPAVSGQSQIKLTIDEKLAEAQTCFAESHFACAVGQAMVVVSLDGNNTAAATLMKNAQLDACKNNNRQPASAIC